MPSYFLKSKLLRSEIKHWLLVTVLFLWSFTATYISLTEKEKIILIGMDEAGTRLITESSDRLLKSELKNFLTNFFGLYYSYDEKTYQEKMGEATDLMTDQLWDLNKEKLFEIHKKLEKTPLTQKNRN